MHRSTRWLNRFVGALLLATLGLSLVAGAGTGAIAAVPNQQGVPTGTSLLDKYPNLLVFRVYFRNTAERDNLANDFGAEEVTTTGGYLTFLKDRATYNEFV